MSEESKMLIEESEFKGRPVLIIKNDENDRFPFSFGLGKARKVLGAYEAIQNFVKKYDVDKGEQQAPPEG